MNIVILDGHTANPGDLSWEAFEQLGNLKVYPRTKPSEIIERSKDADCVFTNKTVLTGEILSSLPRLKFIGVLATGYNVVDVKTAAALGIVVSNVPSYSTMSVAQNVFALLLDITNEVAHYSSRVRGGDWVKSPDFSFTDTELIELSGKKMGIVGFGEIGSKVAAIAQAFGMEVHAFSSKSQAELGQVIKTGLDDLFKVCDVISLHCPLTENTFHLVDRRRISLMKKNAILINTGRGQLVDEEALAKALNENRIFAAGIDVLSQEPPAPDAPLLSARNCRITPHISWATRQARERLLAVSADNLRAFLDGKPINVVS